MIEIGRRGFFTGLAALIAAPAIIRVAPLMPISSRWTPAYVPIDWLAQQYGMLPEPLGGQDEWLALRAEGMKLLGLAELRKHGWSRPMADNWVDINDHDPGYIRQWALNESDWGRGQHWWGNA